MTTGRPMRPTTSWASSMVWAVPEAGAPRPISAMATLNCSRSSAVAMAVASAPISSTPSRSSTPASTSSMARLRAVWPPSVGSRASGCSRSMILVSTSMSRGST